MSQSTDTKKKKNPRSPLSKAVFALILTLAIGVFLISGLKLLSITTSYKEGTDSYKKVVQSATKTEPEKDYPTVDFNALLSQNPDTVGYIFIKDAFEYPIVQGTDNDKYLHTMFDGTYNDCGSIFVDANIPEGLEAKNAIVYGHNMNDGSMFGQLYKYSDPEYYNSHRTVHIYTPEHHYLYKVIAAYTASVEGFTYQYSFADDEEFMNFLNETRNASWFDMDTELNADSKIITLSTCVGSNDDNYRNVVILVREGEITE